MAYDRFELEGMTTNERLFEVGLLDEYDTAIAGRDTEKVRTILESIYVDELSIARILSQIRD